MSTPFLALYNRRDRIRLELLTSSIQSLVDLQQAVGTLVTWPKNDNMAPSGIRSQERLLTQLENMLLSTLFFVEENVRMLEDPGAALDVYATVSLRQVVDGVDLESVKAMIRRRMTRPRGDPTMHGWRSASWLPRVVRDFFPCFPWSNRAEWMTIPGVHDAKAPFVVPEEFLAKTPKKAPKKAPKRESAGEIPKEIQDVIFEEFDRLRQLCRPGSVDHVGMLKALDDALETIVYIEHYRDVPEVEIPEWLFCQEADLPEMTAELIPDSAKEPGVEPNETCPEKPAVPLLTQKRSDVEGQAEMDPGARDPAAKGAWDCHQRLLETLTRVRFELDQRMARSAETKPKGGGEAGRSQVEAARVVLLPEDAMGSEADQDHPSSLDEELGSPEDGDCCWR